MVQNKKILLVDDEKETLKGYEAFLLGPTGPKSGRMSSRLNRSKNEAQPVRLEPPEFQLFLASSGEEAIEIFHREWEKGEPIAAGFFDVNLEGNLDGLQTIQAIRSLDPSIHCVVVTAYQDRSVEEIHKLFGEEFKDQWDYLNKPFSKGEILQKARQMIGSWNRKKELKILQESLMRSERLAGIGQVARSVGHEFNNILMRIMGKADLALRESEMDKIKEHLKVILMATERARVIVRNLQSFSKLDPKLEVVSLEVPIDEALSLVSHEMIKHSVIHEKKIETKAKVKIDVGKMAQVFLNLFLNAIYAIKGGGKIYIWVGQEEVHKKAMVLKCLIEDNGSGIPKSILPHIFDFAFTTKGEEGSGIGLSVSKEILEAHGGQIEVTSEENKGTTFVIQLPVFE